MSKAGEHEINGDKIMGDTLNFLKASEEVWGSGRTPRRIKSRGLIYPH